MSLRHLTPEKLDSLSPSDPAALASRRDLQRLHSILGQKKLWLHWIRSKYPDRPPASLVDLGCGDGHLLTSILPIAFPRGGHGARLFFVDRQPSVSDSTLDFLRRQNWLPSLVSADVHEWAQSAPRVELIIANLFLHHFADEPLKNLFQSLATRTPLFAAAEPHRGVPGKIGSRLLGILGCHPVTQHDARVSVEAGFCGHEISTLWPSPSSWNFQEQSVGLFTHFFSAERID